MNTVIAFPEQRSEPDVHDAIARHQPKFAKALSGIELKTQVLRGGDTLKKDNGNFHIVVSGYVKKTRIDSAGDAHIDGFYYPGDMISGENAQPCQCSFITAYDTACLASLPIGVLFNSATGELSETVVNGLIEELKRANTLAFYVTKKSAVVRLAWFLYTLWSRRLTRFDAAHASDFYMPMPRSDIASYLGLAAETVSREFTHLSRKTLISVDKRIVHVNKPDDLANVAHVSSNPDQMTGVLH